MAETSGTWTNANYLAVAVYRNATTTGDANDSVNSQSGSLIAATINFPALAPTVHPMSEGTGWFVGFATHSTATDIATAPAGMGTRASSVKTAVYDSGGPLSTNWPSTNVTLNNNGAWSTVVVHLAASGTISRVGAAAAEADTVPIPAGHQVGDVMVMHVARNGIGGASVPSGWSALSASGSTTTITHSAWYRVVVSPDSVFIPQISVY